MNETGATFQISMPLAYATFRYKDIDSASSWIEVFYEGEMHISYEGLCRRGSVSATPAGGLSSSMFPGAAALVARGRSSLC